jgi:nucleoside-diphosphate-sugar epimerase
MRDRNPNMRVLITGSSGMIGTNLGLALLDSKAEVAGIDRRPNPWTDRIPTTLMDFSVPDALAQFNWPADVVVHLAANAKVHATVRDPRLAHENISTGIAVLEHVRKHRTALILGSSREVYGNIKRSKTAEKAVFVDESASPYSASKLAVEALAHAYRRCYQLPVVVLRFSNVYGRYDSDLERLERVVPLFIRQIASSSPVVIYGPEKRLDFTYIDDCVSGIIKTIKAMLGGRLTENVINIASGKGSSLVGLAALIGDALGKDPRIIHKASRVGEVIHYVANLNVAKRVLGYRPEVLLPEGIRRSLSWRTGAFHAGVAAQEHRHSLTPYAQAVV